MYINQTEKFWIENPNILFQNCDVIPMTNMSLSNQMNSLSRLVFLISPILYLLLKNGKKCSLLFFLVSLLFIIILYYLQKNRMKEPYQNIRTKNSFNSQPLDMSKLSRVGPINTGGTSRNMFVDRPQALLFCNDAKQININQQGNLSINQQLVGPANPKTFTSPVIVPKIADLAFWADNPGSSYQQINRETIDDTYLSGYDVSTCCSELDACKVPITKNTQFTEEIEEEIEEEIDGDIIENYEGVGNGCSDGTCIQLPPKLKTKLPIISPTPTILGEYIDNEDVIENYQDVSVCQLREKSFLPPPILKSKLPIQSPSPSTTVPYIVENFQIPYIKEVEGIPLRTNQPGWVNTICGYNPENLNSNLPTNMSVGNCQKQPALDNYNKNLFTQTIQPGVYTRNQVVEPINSNIGISFTQQFEPKSCSWDDKGLTYTEHDPRIYDPPPKELEQPVDATEYNVYDPRFSGYGTSYRAYNDKFLGQTKFMYDDVDAIRMPNYITRSNIDFARYADSYGPLTDDNRYGNKNTNHIRAFAQDTFLRNSLKQRDDLMERLLRKRNSELHQLRSHPISTMGQAGLGTKGC